MWEHLALSGESVEMAVRGSLRKRLLATVIMNSRDASHRHNRIGEVIPEAYEPTCVPHAMAENRERRVDFNDFALSEAAHVL